MHAERVDRGGAHSAELAGPQVDVAPVQRRDADRQDAGGDDSGQGAGAGGVGGVTDRGDPQQRSHDPGCDADDEGGAEDPGGGAPLDPADRAAEQPHREPPDAEDGRRPQEVAARPDPQGHLANKVALTQRPGVGCAVEVAAGAERPVPGDLDDSVGEDPLRAGDAIGHQVSDVELAHGDRLGDDQGPDRRRDAHGRRGDVEGPPALGMQDPGPGEQDGEQDRPHHGQQPRRRAKPTAWCGLGEGGHGRGQDVLQLGAPIRWRRSRSAAARP